MKPGNIPSDATADLESRAECILRHLDTVRLNLDFSNQRGASGLRILRKVLCENSFSRIQDGPDADRV